MSKRDLKFIGDVLKDALRPDISNYDIYPRLIFRYVISLDTLLSLFLGKWIESHPDQEWIHSIKEKVLDAILDRDLPIRCEDILSIAESDIARWIIWFFQQELIPCPNMKRLLCEYYSFCRLIPKLIAKEIINYKRIQLILKDFKKNGTKDREIMQAIEEIPLAVKYKDIYLSAGKTKRRTDRQQLLRKRILSELFYLIH